MNDLLPILLDWVKIAGLIESYWIEDRYYQTDKKTHQSHGHFSSSRIHIHTGRVGYTAVQNEAPLKFGTPLTCHCGYIVLVTMPIKRNRVILLVKLRRDADVVHNESAYDVERN